MENIINYFINFFDKGVVIALITIFLSLLVLVINKTKTKKDDELLEKSIAFIENGINIFYQIEKLSLFSNKKFEKSKEAISLFSKLYLENKEKILNPKEKQILEDLWLTLSKKNKELQNETKNV